MKRKTSSVVKFWYPEATYRHPVRRTVLVISEDEDRIVGYELRCGKDVRTFRQAVTRRLIKTYNKLRITRYGQYCTLRDRYPFHSPKATTLRRMDVMSLLYEGA